MIHLDLTRDETETLAAVLESVLADLSYEIAETDRPDVRDRLKERRAVMQRVARALTETRQLV